MGRQRGRRNGNIYQRKTIATPYNVSNGLEELTTWRSEVASGPAFRSEARDAAKLGEIKDQRLAAYGDQIERRHEQGADQRQHEPPYTCWRLGWNGHRAGLLTIDRSSNVHLRHAVSAATSLATARSRIGQCIKAANRPSAMEINHMASYDLVAS